MAAVKIGWGYIRGNSKGRVGIWAWQWGRMGWDTGVAVVKKEWGYGVEIVKKGWGCFRGSSVERVVL